MMTFPQRDRRVAGACLTRTRYPAVTLQASCERMASASQALRTEKPRDGVNFVG